MQQRWKMVLEGETSSKSVLHQDVTKIQEGGAKCYELQHGVEWCSRSQQSVTGWNMMSHGGSKCNNVQLLSCYNVL